MIIDFVSIHITQNEQDFYETDFFPIFGSWFSLLNLVRKAKKIDTKPNKLMKSSERAK